MTTKVTTIPRFRSVYYDTYANLPTSGIKTGDLAYATDRQLLYRWSGSAWVIITKYIDSGVAASIPTATNLPDGSCYYETDTDLLKQVQSSAWVTLDIGSFALQQEIRTGHNQILLPVRALSTQSLILNRLVATAMVLPRAMTISDLVIDVTIAAAAGKIARLGIYNVGTNLYPGSLVIDAGTVAVDSTGLKVLTISGGQSLSKGVYFLAVISDGTDGGPTIKSYSAAWSPIGPTTSSLSDIVASVYKESQNPAALPDPFPTPDGEWGVGYGAVRVSSLD